MANIDKIDVDGTTYDIRDSSAQHDNPGNGTLTITQNGTSKGTFAANQSTASTIDIDVHNGIATANNLTPTEDTPSAWHTLLGSPSDTNYYVTYYNTASKFTNQPSTYGILETFLYGPIIYQRWKPLTTGIIRYRAGNYAGWNGSATASGAFTGMATTAVATTSANGLMSATDKSKLDNLDNTKDVNKNVNSATKLTKTETVLQTNQVPYVSRASLSPEGFSGYIREKIVGGSIAWNQKIPKTATTTTYAGITFTNNDDGSWTLTGTASNNNSFKNIQTITRTLNFLPNHVYFVSAKSGNDKVGLAIMQNNLSNWTNKYIYNTESIVKISDYTISDTSSYGCCARLQVSNALNVDIGTCTYYPMVVDLTLMFGTAIANYIYNLETATAGAGVDYLKSLGLLTKSYYAYDDGNIQSVCVNAKKICGKNLFDKSAINTSNGYKSSYYLDNTGAEVSNANLNISEYIKVVAGETYTYSGTTGAEPSICFYDSSKTFISGNKINNEVKLTVQAPSNSCYVRLSVRKSQIDVTQLEFGSTATSYEPYHIDTIHLSGSELRGIVLKDTSNNLYYDGDEYTSDGKIKRKYKRVDMGTLNWTYSTNNYFYTLDLTDKAYNQHNICAIYTLDTSAVASMADKTFKGSTSNYNLYVKDSAYTDAATFKAAMSGVYLVYELATSTTEEAIPYQNPQLSGDSEEFVDGKTRDMIIPVGHVTEYMGTTAGEYQYMPTMPVDDGKYNLVTDGHCVEWEKQNGWKYVGNTVLTTPYVYNSNPAIKEVKIRLTCILGDFQQVVGFVEFDDESSGYFYCSIGNKDDLYAKFLISKTIIQPISIIVSNNDVTGMDAWVIYIHKR